MFDVASIIILLRQPKPPALPSPLSIRPSAGSSGILCKRLLGFTVVVFMDPLLNLRAGQLPVGFDDRPLAVQPLRLDRIEPRRLHGQVADPDLAAARVLHAPVVRPDPTSHAFADVPGGVVPDQHENLLALRREPLAQPAQVILGHLADRPALHETQQHLSLIHISEPTRLGMISYA